MRHVFLMLVVILQNIAYTRNVLSLYISHVHSKVININVFYKFSGLL